MDDDRVKVAYEAFVAGFVPGTCPVPFDELSNFWKDTLRVAYLQGILDDEANPSDIRQKGWVVAVHNDYKLDGVPHTFWLFTRGSNCVKGEGRTDADALNVVRKIIDRTGGGHP